MARLGSALVVAVFAMAACGTTTGSAGGTASSQPGTAATLAATSTTTPAASTTTTDEPAHVAAATYTGGACEYDGPSQFDLGSTVTFVVSNESDTSNVGFAVWDLPEDVTSEEIHDQGIFAFVAFGNFAAIAFAPTAIGEPEELTVTFETPGQWGLNCYDESGGAPGIDYVTLFTING